MTRDKNPQLTPVPAVSLKQAMEFPMVVAVRVSPPSSATSDTRSIAVSRGVEASNTIIVDRGGVEAGRRYVPSSLLISWRDHPQSSADGSTSRNSDAKSGTKSMSRRSSGGSDRVDSYYAAVEIA